MPSITKHPTGWRAQIARNGIRRSKVFATKREAQDWANREEHLILQGQGKYGPGTLGDLLDRYAREVSPKRKGHRWEAIRIEALRRDPVADIALKRLGPADLASWRDRRLAQVSGPTVRREMELVSAALSVARKEWGLIPVNPMQDVARPGNSKARDRRVSDAEIEALQDKATSPVAWRVIQAFRFAVETGMRAGEIAALRWPHITGRVAHIPDSKNGAARDVPLSWTALAILCTLPPSPNVFNLTARQIDANFRKIRDAAGIEGLHFHDSRGEAATRLSKRIDAFELARMLGHRDLKMTLRYYRASPQDVAERLG